MNQRPGHGLRNINAAFLLALGFFEAFICLGGILEDGKSGALGQGGKVPQWDLWVIKDQLSTLLALSEREIVVHMGCDAKITVCTTITMCVYQLNVSE